MDFRLVIEAPSDHSGPSFELEGKTWCLSDSLDVQSMHSSVPNYTCVSYVWGDGRVPNPIHPRLSMSNHTLPALAAAIRTQPAGTGFWMDAFCVPVERTTKTATLASMGFIYSRATTVVVILSEVSLNAFQEIAAWDYTRKADPPKAPMDVLEQDMWIRSVWTYQEVVNSQSLLFAGDGVQGTSTKGADFLNGLGHYMMEYKKQNNLTAFDFRTIHPGLDTFEDLIADWLVADYTDRSACQVVSGVQQRKWAEDRNYFYSIIGAVTQVPMKRPLESTTETLAKAFMTVCADKGDYSFIFFANERDNRAGMGWCPSAGIFRMVVPWHYYGERQPGKRDSKGVLTIEDMVRLERSASIGDDAKRFVETFVQGGLQRNPFPGTSTLSTRLYNRLQQMGFSGSAMPLTTTDGFFFPQWQIEEGEVEVWRSSVVRAAFGGPGLAVVLIGGGKTYVPGIFVGSVALGVGKQGKLVIDTSQIQPSDLDLIYRTIPICVICAIACYFWRRYSQ